MLLPVGPVLNDFSKWNVVNINSYKIDFLFIRLVNDKDIQNEYRTKCRAIAYAPSGYLLL